MTYRLFLDDIRNVSNVYSSTNEHRYITVRNFEEFKSVITEKGLPEFISFDKFITEKDFEKNNFLEVNFQGMYTELLRYGFEYSIQERYSVLTIVTCCLEISLHCQ